MFTNGVPKKLHHKQKHDPWEMLIGEFRMFGGPRRESGGLARGGPRKQNKKRGAKSPKKKKKATLERKNQKRPTTRKNGEKGGERGPNALGHKVVHPRGAGVLT